MGENGTYRRLFFCLLGGKLTLKKTKNNKELTTKLKTRGPLLTKGKKRFKKRGEGMTGRDSYEKCRDRRQQKSFVQEIRSLQQSGKKGER